MIADGGAAPGDQKLKPVGASGGRAGKTNIT